MVVKGMDLFTNELVFGFALPSKIAMSIYDIRFMIFRLLNYTLSVHAVNKREHDSDDQST